MGVGKHRHGERLLYKYVQAYVLAVANQYHKIYSVSGASCVVVSVDYRLGPEEPYPAAVEDAEEAWLWVYEKGKTELGIDPTKIAVGGSSA